MVPGRSVLRDNRAAKTVVDAYARDVERVVDRAPQGAGEAAIGVGDQGAVGAEVNVEVFGLHAPGGRKFPLSACADCPASCGAGVGVGRAGFGRGRRSACRTDKLI